MYAQVVRATEVEAGWRQWWRRGSGK